MPDTQQETWTPAQYREYVKTGKRPISGQAPVRARGRTCHEPGKMNRTEAAYAGHLESERQAGAISSWRFESLKLRLADRTFWTPDFLVVASGGFLELHEVKGHMEDDAAVKLKVAAEMYHEFRVILVRKRAGGWERKEL